MADFTIAAAYNYPFGLREIRIKTGSTNTKLNAAQTLTVNEEVQTGELLGDDAVVAEHSFPVKVTWELEAGGIPLAAWAQISGRAVTQGTGTTPNRVNTLVTTKGDQYPYFEMWGRSVADDGSDVWVHLLKCKVTQPIQGQFSQGNFRTSGIKGVAIADSTNGDKFMEIIQHETATILPTT